MTPYYPSWRKKEVLNFIDTVVTIERPKGNLESVLIKNILFDKKSDGITEILYVENKGAGVQCLLKPGKDVIIKPTGEKPIIKPLDKDLDINVLAGDKG